jgi:hypothetical protein
MKRLGTGPFLLLGVLGLGAARPAPAALVVDDFSTAQSAVIAADGPSTASSSQTAPEALGGERDLLVTRTDGSGELSATVDDGMSGWLIFSAGADAAGDLAVTWDGPDADPLQLDPTGLGGADLGSAGLDAFSVSASADLPTSLVLRVYDASDASGNTWSAATLPVSGGGGAPVPQRVPFASFTGTGSGGPADFGNVGAVTLEVSGPAGLDLIVDSVRVVPEPRGAAGAALAALALVAAGRRARERAARRAPSAAT